MNDTFLLYHDLEKTMKEPRGHQLFQMKTIKKPVDQKGISQTNKSDLNKANLA